MTIANTLLTAEDLWQLPDDGQRHELVHGKITTMPLAGGEHGSVAMSVAAAMGFHVEANELGTVLAAGTGFIISRNPDTVRAPDAAFISQSRLPKDGLPQGFVPFAPDIAVEVLSPSDSQIDTEDKIQQWLDAGTRLVWVVNPHRKTVSVHKHGSDPRVLRGADTLSGEDVCPGFSLKVAEIFA